MANCRRGEGKLGNRKREAKQADQHDSLRCMPNPPPLGVSLFRQQLIRAKTRDVLPPE